MKKIASVICCFTISLSASLRSTLRFVFLLSAILGFSSTASAADLMTSYKLALKNDAAWNASINRHEAGKIYEELGRSGLLPKIQAQAGYSRYEYSSDSSLSNFNTDVLEGISDCFSAGSNFNDCLRASEVPQCISTSENLFECLLTSGGDGSSFDSVAYGVSMTQPIFRVDRWNEYRRGQLMARQAELEYLIAHQDLMLKVISSYINVLRAKENVAFLKAEGERITMQLELTKNRFQKGLAVALEVFEAQSIADMHSATLLGGKNLELNAKEDLEILTGESSTNIVPLPLDIPMVPPNPADINAWVAMTRQANMEIRLADIGERLAIAQHAIRKSARLPQIDFIGSHSITTSGGSTTSIASGDTTSTSLGINLSVPLYSGGLITASERQANLNRIEAEYRTKEAYRLAEATSRKAYRAAEASLERVNAQAVAVESSEKALNAVAQGYERGVRSVPEWLQAQRAHFSARRDLVQARYDYLLSSLQLKRTAGILTEEDIAIVNAWLVTADSEPMQDTVPGVTGPTRTAPRRVQKQQSLFDEIPIWMQRPGTDAPQVTPK